MNPIHRPKILNDVENAFAYLIMLGICTFGIFFVLGGMVSPIFLPPLFKKINLGKASEKDKQIARIKTVIGLIIWFILAWTFFILAQRGPYGEWH